MRDAQALTGGIGPRGRHVHKSAFALAVEAAVAQVVRAEEAAALRAMAEDERYAAAMAADAVALRQRAHAGAIRSRVRSAVTGALQRCRALAVPCELTAACGTGQCPFAPPELRGASGVQAPPGRIPRPGGHYYPGQGFSDSAAAAWLVEEQPWQASVCVSDTELASSADEAAA